VSQVGWYFALACLAYTLCQMVTTAAWRETIAPGESRASYLHLLAVFQAGFAVNAVTPGGTLGEVLRGTLLRGYVRGPALVASLISHSFFLTVASSLAAVVGSGLCLLFLDLPARVLGTIFGLAVLFLLPLVLVAWLLRRGAAGMMVRLLRRLPFVRLRDPEALVARARSVDANIHALRRDHPERFRRIVVWLALSRILQTGELWLYLLALLPDRSPVWLALLALLTESANQIVTWALTVVPGQIGVAEGNASLVYGLLGLNPVVGLTVALMRRIRTILGIAVGLAVGWLLGLRRTAPPEAADAG
jgi:hypothetical protein